MDHLSNDSLGDKWLARELQHVNFGDKRLTKRLVHTCVLLEEKASGSPNESCGTWKEAKGAYRLLSNQKLETQEIYCSHYKETRKRLKAHKFVFSLQDTTYLDFDSHVKTQGLGSISKAYTKHKKGLILHSALIVSLEGLPLGLTSQQCWARVMREENSQEKASRQYRTSSQNKESYKWITSLKETLLSIPEETQVITLGDRESDIFEFLWDAQALATLFVIRNRQNRRFICPKIG